MEAVQNWARSMSIVAIHKFMGLTSYYYWFMKGFVDVTPRIQESTGKG